jgi:DNA repair exonuclease SbcCD ATPase subunit
MMSVMYGCAAALAFAVIVVVAVTTQQGGSKGVELESVANRLGYSLDRKPAQMTMLEEEAKPVVAPVPAISAVAGAHAASRGAAGEANALESQIGDLKKEIQAIANTKELEAKLQAKIAQDRRNDEADVAHELALQKTLAELKLLAKEKFDQINMDKEKEGGLTAEEAAQLDQQILALENSLKVLESKMMEIEHDITALHAHEKMSRNAVADGEAVLHAEAVEQAEEEAAHEATEADEASLNKQLEVEYADQTEITNMEAEINADKSFVATLEKHIKASETLSEAEKAQLEAELKAEEADLTRLEGQLKEQQAKLKKDAEMGAELREKYAGDLAREHYDEMEISMDVNEMHNILYPAPAAK